MTSLIKFNPYKSFWPSIFDDNWEFPSVFDAHGVDIYETDEAIVVEAQLPGIKEEDVNVHVEGNVLTISAESKETEEQKARKKTVYRSSRQTSFNYSTSLPKMVNGSQAEAEMENGVLTVTIPKSEEEKAKKIEVRRKN